MPRTAPEPFPKIELHVHLEGTVRPDTLRSIAKRNDYPLPGDLESLYAFRDFAHFIEVWILTTNALRRAEDFRQVVTEYAAEAASHGAVYLEGIFSPAERVARGVEWDEIFSGYCDGAQEARELHGVEVEISPAEQDDRRTHKDVLERRISGRPAYTAVFDKLAQGQYTLWTHGVPSARGVAVSGGEIATVDWTVAGDVAAPEPGQPKR